MLRILGVNKIVNHRVFEQTLFQRIIGNLRLNQVHLMPIVLKGHTAKLFFSLNGLKG